MSLLLLIIAVLTIGFKEITKYKKELIEENIKLKLVDEKDIKKGEDE